MFDGLVPDSQAVCGFTDEDFAQVMSDLLPVGWVWPRDPDSVQSRTMAGLAVEFARIYGRDCDLLAESYPCQSFELLPDWERLLGLPDPCTGPLDTVQERQAAVCAKMAATGGASIAYILSVLVALGYEARIVEYAPFVAGGNDAGDRVFTDDWRFAWTVVAARTQIIYFLAGGSTAGEPLRSWGDQVLECAVARLAPAHTVPLISYSLDRSIWDEGNTTWDAGSSIWDENIIRDEAIGRGFHVAVSH